MRLAIAPLCVALVAATAAPASACFAAREFPTKAHAAAAQAPRIGFVGRVGMTHVIDGYSGKAIVEIAVVDAFGAKLPSTIHVVNPGCCTCVSIGGEPGQEVTSIVRRGDDGLFHLDY
jgi:hypothetical protein